MNDPMKIKALREVVRIGIITILAVIDRDKRFLSELSSGMLTAINDANAYGWNEVRVFFIPSPKEISRAERVEEWLVWLRAEYDKQTVSRLFAWAREIPLWQIAQREHCHERTINNRIDRSMAAIWNEFSVEQQITIEAIDPPIERRKYFPINGFQSEKSIASHAGLIGGHTKCWIDGVGFMREGKRLRDGRHKAESKELHRDRPR